MAVTRSAVNHGQGLVGIDGEALVVVTADSCGDAPRSMRPGSLLAWLMTPPAWRDRKHGGRTAEHLDLLDIEGFPVVLGHVANAIEIQVAEGGKTAQGHVIADAPALAGVVRQAGDVAQGFP